MAVSNSESIRFYRTRIWVWAIVIVVVAAAAYWYFNVGQKPSGTNRFRQGAMGAMAVPVKVAPVQSGRINFTLKAIGTVSAFNTVTVRSRVDGELQKILFTDGQKVQEGDVLAQIDPRTYQVQLEQALGQQKQNQALLANARRDLQRYQQLYKQNSIAKQQVDTQSALVQQYLGSQKSDQAAVDSAKLQLSFTTITAPLSGRLGLRKVDQGNLIAASNVDGLVVITQTQPISVVFTLPQAQVPSVLTQLRAGKRLGVDLYDRDDLQKIATGELMSIDNQIDVATGTLKLKARFANDDESLFPNQFVNVRLNVSADDTAVVIPTIAVQQGSIGAFVYTVNNDNKVHVQRVVTGTIEGNRVAIKDGLSVGQRVVTEGVDRLREGSLVEVVAPDAATPVASGLPSGVQAGATAVPPNEPVSGASTGARGTGSNPRSTRSPH
ncbi:MAG TPA: MdtA/MuxA family multidrug efflux RND transporter periplasmic adaptor subunit [Eoetvoesiella sp.]